MSLVGLSLLGRWRTPCGRRGGKWTQHVTTQCLDLKDLIGEVEKDPWGLAFKIVTKRLVSRRKTPGLDNPDRVKYIVGSLFPHVEPFQRQDRSSCVVRDEELSHSRRTQESGWKA